MLFFFLNVIYVLGQETNSQEHFVNGNKYISSVILHTEALQQQPVCCSRSKDWWQTVKHQKQVEARK